VDAPDEEVSAADLLEEQQRRSDRNTENTLKRERLRKLGAEFNSALAEVERLEAALAAAGAKVEELRSAGKKMKDEVAALEDPDLTEIPQRIRDVEETNRRVRTKRERAALVAQVRVLDEKAAGLTAEIEKVDAQKSAALAQASLPVPGLSFTDDGVLLNDLPFEQAAASEQLRVSMAVALATHPKLPIALIRDASLLDADALALVGEMAEQAGAQVWLEMVSAEGEGIVIEDGQVEGAAAPEEAARA
jgi:hypothetical protein